MFTPSPRKKTLSRSGLFQVQAVPEPTPEAVSITLATAIAIEFSSLRTIGNCPTGIYIAPTPETIRVWKGVFFVHQGPYAGSILRFTLEFQTSFPSTRPCVHFDTDVFHPLVEPKTREWIPHGPTAQWQPGVHHVTHLLHALKASFKTRALNAVTEADAANRQVWSMYHHSPQTFLSLTAQRARSSTTRQALYPPTILGSPSFGASGASPTASPSPKSARRAGTGVGPGAGTSDLFRDYDSHAVDNDGVIRFRQLDEAGADRLWTDLRKSLGDEPNRNYSVHSEEP